MSEKQPDGIIFLEDFYMDDVPRTASLFFDDYDVNIIDVQKEVNKKGLLLRSVYCPPEPIAWHDANGRPFNSVADYHFLKSLDVSFTDDFREFIEKKDKLEVGKGITPAMIREIIHYETTSFGDDYNRVYFFDFDMVLNQLSGLDFRFLSIQPDNEDSLLHQYAKYIFSDHIGPEPEGGRLTLLQTMFRKIGHERIYVITSNSFANKEILYKSGNMVHNPYLNHFIAILQILLPTFLPNHLVCTNSKNQPPLYNKKSAAIIDILEKRAETMRKPQSVKPQSTISKNSVKTKSVKPQPVKPQSAIDQPRVLRSSSVRNRKGGSKRRMRGRCTRRKRRITG